MTEKLDTLITEEERKEPRTGRERAQEERIAILEADHKEVLNQLKEANFDGLTGLMKREPFEEEIKNHLENSTALSFIIFDIDHFKKVNDIGDIVLTRVAEVIGNNTRNYDPTCRWGGEEIALAMIEADEEQAKYKANFIREKIEKIDFSDLAEENPKLKDFKVTVSAGVAFSKQLSEFKDLFKAADKALYRSKHHGRNRVTTYSAYKKLEKDQEEK